MTVCVNIAAVHPKMGTPGLPWPERKSEQAAGFDCCAAVDEPIRIRTGCIYKIPLGFALSLPYGYEAQIRPRSGLSSEGLIMPNSPGTIDADYRGQVHAVVYFLPICRGTVLHLAEEMIINPGDRIAQMVIAPVPDVKFAPCSFDNLSKTARGQRGFGSTGVSVGQNTEAAFFAFALLQLDNNQALVDYQVNDDKKTLTVLFRGPHGRPGAKTVDLPDDAIKLL